MKKYNSYIFLSNPFKERKPKPKPNPKENVIEIEIGNTVYSYIDKLFPDFISIKDNDNIFRHSIKGEIAFEKFKCSVEIVLHEVRELNYLDVYVEGKTTSQIIHCLEYIQNCLLTSGIREHYIEIISYDAVSEYYCNKILPKLNSLERNLRKLLFNIYILNFGKDYYEATMDESLQKKIKSLINVSAKNQLNDVRKSYSVSKKDAEAIVRSQYFFYSFEFTDIQELLFTPRWTKVDEEEKNKFLTEHYDLSQLTDDELRQVFDKYSPKSDWDRFFSKKIPIDNITELIDEIRKYRNAAAHFKFFSKSEYQTCSKKVDELNKAILEAIKITEEKDFTDKNLEMIKKALSGALERFRAAFEPLVEMQKNMYKVFAESIQPVITATENIRKSFASLLAPTILLAQSISDVSEDENSNPDSDSNSNDSDDNNSDIT